MTNFKVLMDVNFWGSVYPTYFAIPHLKASKGRVVVMSSMAGYTFVPRMAFYSASKGALISFYDTLRMEFGSEIAISIVAPGVIRAMLGLVAVQPAKDFAKAAVSHAWLCTGARYIIEPKVVVRVVLSSSIPSRNSGLLAEATVLVVPSGTGHKISFQTNVVLSHKEAFVCTVNTVSQSPEIKKE
ncbi:hypothetical protein LUZ61_020907 [Rhynchospora tenuis]|uniref:Uncharacterized protein n=1 Tax=Rhynchospora tenuis TaxID=198213 RepID=A0AAD6EP99_9POAL|nr:hypothetical protein LUZ61_020907 [Rhynchospora tenuis]